MTYGQSSEVELLRAIETVLCEFEILIRCKQTHVWIERREQLVVLGFDSGNDVGNVQACDVRFETPARNGGRGDGICADGLCGDSRAVFERGSECAR